MWKDQFRHALALLSILPVKVKNSPNAISTLFYPLVGGLFSLVCVLLWVLLSHDNPIFVASLIITLFIILSGGLHLDGLADCIDGLYAYHGNQERLREVMKSPEIGSMGAIAIIITIVLKITCLADLLAFPTRYWALIFIPIISRSAAMIYMHLTPYASKQGIAVDLHSSPRLGVAGVAVTVVFILAMLVPFLFVALLCLVTGVVLISWRSVWMARLGGYSGDCVGALIEIVELTLLVFLVIVRSYVF